MKYSLFLAVAFAVATCGLLPPIDLSGRVDPELRLKLQSIPGGPLKREVIKIEKSAVRITLKHHRIMNLEITAMTMVGRISDNAMLDKVAPAPDGRIRFEHGRVSSAFAVAKINRTL